MIDRHAHKHQAGGTPEAARDIQNRKGGSAHGK